MDQSTINRWLLPDGVDELLPDAAWSVEQYRRAFMDCCKSWGFELVDPPLIEYLDSLLTGSGETMDLQTFKLVDQHNGRAMGVRADMTPQVARIDAHSLQRDVPNRFFYTGSVLRARTDGFGGSRSPRQFGAELFGHAGPESDIEIIRLMLAALDQAPGETPELMLDLGHVGVYRGIVDALGLDDSQEAQLFAAVQRGSIPDIKQLLASQKLANVSDEHALEMVSGFMRLQGDETILTDAKALLKHANTAAIDALDNLQQIISAIKTSNPTMRINIDLADLRGYRYHTGVLFAAYTPDGIELARGGRYDAIGAAFGHARPATGFSGDLKRVIDSISPHASAAVTGVFVPWAIHNDALAKVEALRDAGERVVVELPGSGSTAQNSNCDRQLQQQQSEWVLAPILIK